MSKYVGFRLGKVHESHVISEYYCGGCGYPVTDHDSFCPECGGAFRECDASNLEEENAKLRTFLGGGSIVTDYWKDEDGTMHVLTTDGEHTYEYMRGGLADENARLRELVARMAEALGIDCEWADPEWCKSPCVLEFGCWPEGDHMSIRCPAWAAMHELGIEVEDGTE